MFKDFPAWMVITTHVVRRVSFLRKEGEAKMVDTKIPNILIKLIEKWMDKKKTGSLQINFIKGEINSAYINLAISLGNSENPG